MVVTVVCEFTTAVNFLDDCILCRPRACADKLVNHWPIWCKHRPSCACVVVCGKNYPSPVQIED